MHMCSTKVDMQTTTVSMHAAQNTWYKTVPLNAGFFTAPEALGAKVAAVCVVNFLSSLSRFAPANRVPDCCEVVPACLSGSCEWQRTCRDTCAFAKDNRAGIRLLVKGDRAKARTGLREPVSMPAKSAHWTVAMATVSLCRTNVALRNFSKLEHVQTKFYQHCKVHRILVCIQGLDCT